MEPITSSDAAARMARTIASDILLYNRDAWQAGQDLSPKIAEGRAFFQSRVEASLFGLYDRILVEAFRNAGVPVAAYSGAVNTQTIPTAARAGTRGSLHAQPAESSPAGPRRGGSAAARHWRVLVFGAVLALLTLAITALMARC